MRKLLWQKSLSSERARVCCMREDKVISRSAFANSMFLSLFETHKCRGQEPQSLKNTATMASQESIWQWVDRPPTLGSRDDRIVSRLQGTLKYISVLLGECFSIKVFDLLCSIFISFPKQRQVPICDNILGHLWCTGAVLCMGNVEIRDTLCHAASSLDSTLLFLLPCWPEYPAPVLAAQS